MPVKILFLLQRKVTQASERDLKYQTIMRNLVRRYVTQVLKMMRKEAVLTTLLIQEHFHTFTLSLSHIHTFTFTTFTTLLIQEQRKAENEGVTEDDVNEIKNDISAFR